MSSPCFLLVRVAIGTQLPKKHPAVCPRLLGSDALVRGAASWPRTTHLSASLNARLGGGVGRRGGGDNSQLQFCSAAAAPKTVLDCWAPKILSRSYCPACKEENRKERNVFLFYNACQAQTCISVSLLPFQNTHLGEHGFP